MAYGHSGMLPDLLRDEPDLNPLVAHVWTWFLELQSSRASYGYGPMPITWADIFHWQQITKTQPAAWELRALRMMDSAYLEQARKK